MAMYKFDDVVTDDAGNVVAGATVTVTDFASGALAALRQDDETTVVSNPLTTDAHGRLQFNIAAGTYNITISKSGVTTNKTKILIGSLSSGASYAGTSTSSLATAASGSKVFATQTGLAYQAGTRMRATSVGTSEWMEGVVASYVGGVLTMTADLASGSGTHADWNLNVTGEHGAAGAAGATGSNGANGISDSIYVGYNFI